MADLKRILQENDDLREVLQAIVAVQPSGHRTASDCLSIVQELVQSALEQEPVYHESE